MKVEQLAVGLKETLLEDESIKSGFDESTFSTFVLGINTF